MITFSSIGFVILGIGVIVGLIRSGEIGCSGYLMIAVLAIILFGSLAVVVFTSLVRLGM